MTLYWISLITALVWLQVCVSQTEKQFIVSDDYNGKMIHCQQGMQEIERVIQEFKQSNDLLIKETKEAVYSIIIHQRHEPCHTSRILQQQFEMYSRRKLGLMDQLIIQRNQIEKGIKWSQCNKKQKLNFESALVQLENAQQKVSAKETQVLQLFNKLQLYYAGNSRDNNANKR